jgi:hypothetical protein
MKKYNPTFDEFVNEQEVNEANKSKFGQGVDIMDS